MSLGKTLAYFEHFENEGQVSSPHFAAKQIDEFQAIRQRLQSLDDISAVISYLDKIPEEPCPAENSFLFDNIDFFLINIFLLRKHDPGKETKNRMYKHLNDCYHCFDLNAQVNAEYQNTKKQLRERG